MKTEFKFPPCRFPRQVCGAGYGAVLLLLTSLSVATATERFWTDVAGDFDGTFSDNNHWDGGDAPGSGDIAIFDQDGETFTVDFDGNETNSRLILRNGEITFDLTDGVDSFTYSLTNSAAIGQPPQSIVIGESSGDDVALRLLNGTLSSQGVRIANVTGSTGSVIVDTGAAWNSATDFVVGREGVGSVTVRNGGSLTSGSGSRLTILGHLQGGQGTVTVTGAGSSWTISGNEFWLGANPNTQGTLNIEAGGTVTSNAAFIGFRNDGEGFATVTGSGSSWTSNTSIYVGGNNTGSERGVGSFEILNGGEVDIDNVLGVWDTGELHLDNLSSIQADSTAFETGAGLFYTLESGSPQPPTMTIDGLAEIDGVDFSLLVGGAFSADIDDMFTLMSYGSLTGIFEGLPNNSVIDVGGYLFSLDYGATTSNGFITLTVIPEPSSAVLLLGSLISLLLLSRRRYYPTK